MTEYELDIILDQSNFEQENLIKGKGRVLVNDSENETGYKVIMTDCYQLPGYESFGLRQYGNQWVLSIAGKLLTYGSYDHVIDTIKLVIKNLTSCWHSETSILYFLGLPDYGQIIKEIVAMRESDHSFSLIQ